MNIQKVCKNVYFDQDSNKFFCGLCGKATFDTKAQAVGHLSVCKAKDTKYHKSPLKQSVKVVEGSGNNIAEVVVPVVDCGGDQKTLGNSSGVVLWLGQERKIAILEQQVATLQKSLVKYENEIPHIQAIQQYNSNDWFANNRGILIVAGTVILAALLFRESSSCKCANEGSGRSRTLGISSTLTNKAAGKVIDYGLSKILK